VDAAPVRRGEARAEPGGEEDEPLVTGHAPEPGGLGRRGLGADGGPEAHPARGGAAGSPGACTSSISCPSGSTMKQAADWYAGKRITVSSSTRSPAARSAARVASRSATRKERCVSPCSFIARGRGGGGG